MNLLDLTLSAKADEIGGIMRKLALATLTLIAVFVGLSAYANTWYVKTDGDNINDGLSWANAKATIQAGIDAAEDGDTVLVADGTYMGDGNRDIDFQGKTITVKSANGAENCIIDCQGILDKDEHIGFYFHNGETSDAKVDGFTIKNGEAFRPAGGICCENFSSPTITNNIIINNSSDWGGGISCWNSSPFIINNTIKDNTAYNSGGGIACLKSSSPIIKNNIIMYNSADAWGGGGIVCWDNSSPIIINNIISGNTVPHGGKGGGIYCVDSSKIKIINNTITKNSSESGGGICCANSSHTVLNTILWANSPNEIYLLDSTITITITYSNIQGGWEGEGNIDADPLFVDADNGDYYLQSGSPCLSTGTMEWTYEGTTYHAPDTDIEGHQRPLGSGIDMGAYEQFDDGSIPTSIELVDKKIVTWGSLKTELLQIQP